MTEQNITSLQNPLVKHVVKLRLNRRYRESQGTVLLAGYKLVREISQIVAAERIYTESSTEFLPAKEVYRVTPEVLKKITGLPAPEGIAAEFPLPPSSELEKHTPLLVLEGINDPGNLGTLIRTALALGWKGVFLLPNCVDPFHEKVLRSSRAALFRLPWRIGDWESLIGLREKNQLTAYIADIQGESIRSLHPEKNCLLLLSNEAQGPSEKAKFFGKKITIPMSGKMESLNVAIAGAILMYNLNYYE